MKNIFFGVSSIFVEKHHCHSDDIISLTTWWTPWNYLYSYNKLIMNTQSIRKYVQWNHTKMLPIWDFWATFVVIIFLWTSSLCNPQKTDTMFAFQQLRRYYYCSVSSHFTFVLQKTKKLTRWMLPDETNFAFEVR